MLIYTRMDKYCLRKVSVSWIMESANF
jgi:hypothetical protein